MKKSKTTLFGLGISTTLLITGLILSLIQLPVAAAIVTISALLIKGFILMQKLSELLQKEQRTEMAAEGLFDNIASVLLSPAKKQESNV